MRISKTTTTVTMAVVCALALYGRPVQATTLFDDTFNNGSTTGYGDTPTSNSTSYDQASTKPSTTTVAANDLNVALPSTTSGAVEEQALFTSSPVTLSAAGNYVDLTITFVNHGIASSGAVDNFTLGLFNSGGVSPLLTMQSSLSQTIGGGVQNWLGFSKYYVGRRYQHSRLFGRPAQSLASGAQDLLFSGSFTGAYCNPKGIQSGSTIAGFSLVDGSTYTGGLQSDVGLWRNYGKRDSL